MKRPVMALGGLAIALVGCGGAQMSTGIAPAPGPTRASAEATLVVMQPGTPEIPGDGLDARRPEPASEEAQDAAQQALERARELYRDLQFDQSLVAVGEAQRHLESSPHGEGSLEALHRALLLRGMNELALDRADRAEEAFRTAVALRPEEELGEGDYAPSVREAYARARSEVQAEPPASLTVTTEPPGARVQLDGRPAGTAPVTVTASPGRHYLRVDAFGHQSRVLSVTLGEQSAIDVSLPGADEATVLAQLAEVDLERLQSIRDATRRRLARTLGVDALIVLAPADDGVQGVGLQLQTGEIERATIEDAEPQLARALVDRLRAGSAGGGDPAGERDAPDARAGGVWASPWLWTGIGAAVVAAGAATAAVLLTRDSGQRFVLDPAGP